MSRPALLSHLVSVYFLINKGREQRSDRIVTLLYISTVSEEATPTELVQRTQAGLILRGLRSNSDRLGLEYALVVPRGILSGGCPELRLVDATALRRGVLELEYGIDICKYIICVFPDFVLDVILFYILFFSC